MTPAISSSLRWGPARREDRTMKRSRISERQIMGILREQEAAAKMADVCRRHGISSATFYAWKAKFGGMDACEARRLRILEDENPRLKPRLADAVLDKRRLMTSSEIGADARRQAADCRSRAGPRNRSNVSDR